MINAIGGQVTCRKYSLTVHLQIKHYFTKASVMADRKRDSAGRFVKTAKGVNLYLPYTSAREKYGKLNVTTRASPRKETKQVPVTSAIKTLHSYAA